MLLCALLSVNITFVNYAGVRTTLSGFVGESLLEAAARNHYKFVDGACGGGGAPAEHLHKQGSWYEPKYGEGPMCNHCHVIIPKTHFGSLEAKGPEEAQQLSLYPFPEDMTET